MNLYEINEQIEIILSQVDENGELPESALDELEILAVDEQTKIENTALYIKHLVADAKAIREEELALAERRRKKENKVDKLKEYLSGYLTAKDYKKYETPRALLSFRKSVRTEVDEKVLPDSEMYWVTTRKPDTAWIKTLLKEGKKVPGAKLVEHQNIQIK
jgi:hypothetical protein